MSEQETTKHPQPDPVVTPDPVEIPRSADQPTVQLPTGGWYGGPPDEPYDRTAAGPPRPVRPTRTGLVVVALAVALVLMAGSALVGGLVGAWASQRLLGAPGPGQTTVIDGPQLDRASLASIAAAVQPSVVSIRAGSGQGSGVILDDQGHILTNAHVVQGAQDRRVSVRFSDGEIAPAAVIGVDRRSDIAVVRAEGGSGLTSAAFGDSGDVLVGDTVLAIGSPLGFEGSVTQGIVSALDRTLRPDAPDAPPLSGLLQTDAAINRGNSGGALVNMTGEVVGINTAIAVADGNSGFLGVGFAVPSNRAIDVAERLIGGEEVRHAFLGVSVIPHPEGGALIGRVEPSSPADTAGLQDGDVIVRLGDRAITDANDLVSAVQASQVGDQVEIEFRRDDVSRTTTVTLGEHEG